MSESDRAHRKDVSRWDLPTVEGATMPRAGAKGVNVMHLTMVEREAWEHGFKDGHVEGVRKEHKFIRAERFAALDEAVDFCLTKGRQIVDEQGEPTSAGLAQVCAKNVCYDVPITAAGQLVRDVNGPMDAPACKLGDGRAWGKLAFPFGEGDTDLGTLIAVALPDFADGAPLATAGSLEEAVAGKSAGEVLTLTLVRDGERSEIQITVGRRPLF